MTAPRLTLLLWGALAFGAGSGCNAVTHGSRLSNRPMDSDGIYLTTGDAPKRFRTVGFVQVRGYGVQVAGYADVGEAQLDGTIKGAMVKEALRLGGNGVIHIEFEDENPTTDVERMQSLSNSFSNFSTGKGGGLETKDRYVSATGEVIQFLE